MRTEKQQIAARINGSKSRGPKSPEGKARSSQNAITHGLHAKAVVLSNENPANLEELREEYYAYWQPQTRVECDLVDDMIQARWRIYRVLATETAALDLEMDRQREAVSREFVRIDEATRTALAFSALAGDGRALITMGRAETRHRRTLDRATDHLLALRAHKEQNEPGGAQPPRNHEPALILIRPESEM